MIRLIETASKELLEELQTFCGSSVFGVKAFGPLLTYGSKYDFVMAWEQCREDGTRTAFLTKYYGSVTVCTVDDCTTSSLRLFEDEKTELVEFLQVIGFAGLVGNPDLLRPLTVITDGMKEQYGAVMSFEKGSQCALEVPTLTENMEYLVGGALDEFYDALTNNFPGYVAEDFGDWAVDFAYRLRYRTACSVLLVEDNVPKATAAALAVLNQSLLMGAISSSEDRRGKHYASGCIQTLCERYPEHKIYLLCKPDKVPYYEHLGMVKETTFLELGSIKK